MEVKAANQNRKQEPIVVLHIKFDADWEIIELTENDYEDR